MLLEWNETTVVWQIMQISKPVKFSRRPGTGSQQYSKQNSSFELRLDLKFALFIRRTDYWNDYWNQICNNRLINPLVRGTLDECACSMEKEMVARIGFFLVWRRRNQLLAGYPGTQTDSIFDTTETPIKQMGWNLFCHSKSGCTFQNEVLVF